MPRTVLIQLSARGPQLAKLETPTAGKWSHLSYVHCQRFGDNAPHPELVERVRPRPSVGKQVVVTRTLRQTATCFNKLDWNHQNGSTLRSKRNENWYINRMRIFSTPVRSTIRAGEKLIRRRNLWSLQPALGFESGRMKWSCVRRKACISMAWSSVTRWQSFRIWIYSCRLSSSQTAVWSGEIPEGNYAAVVCSSN